MTELPERIEKLLEEYKLLIDQTAANKLRMMGIEREVRDWWAGINDLFVKLGLLPRRRNR